VRAGAALCRREEQQLAIARPRFRFGRGDERAAHAGAALLLVDDERAELRGVAVAFERVGDMDAGQADDSAAGFRDQQAVGVARSEPLQAARDRVRFGRIAELTEELREVGGVVGTGVANVHRHGACLDYAPVLGEVLTAIVTPFDDDGRIDIASFRALASHLVDNGSDGLVVTGTTGESPTLSDDERSQLYEAAVDEVGGRATVVAGTGTYSTEHSIHLTERAHELGVDGFLVVTPYYNKPPPRAIVEHFKAIAAVSDKPILVYNIPARVVLNLEPETIAELAEIPTVKAVKQANDDLAQARRIVELGLDLYAGDDPLVLPFVELGGLGGVCVHTHVVGPQVKEMIRRYRAGDHEGAKRLEVETAPALEILKVVVNPIAIKAALNLLGHDVGGVRLPLVEATEDERAQVRGCLERLGLLQPVAV
jgi:4-hydroxy-tetrahydrodipicolinate synthase